MKKLNVNMEKVGDIAKEGCKWAFYGLIAVLPYVSSVKEALESIHYNGNVTYSDVVEVIMNSAMYSGDKHKAVAVLKKDGDSDYYRSVIQVMKSTMYSSDKINIINELSNK